MSPISKIDPSACGYAPATQCCPGQTTTEIGSNRRSRALPTACATALEIVESVEPLTGKTMLMEHQQQLLHDLAITDADLWPAAELVDAYTRLGRNDEAQAVTTQFTAAATAKGQPWSLARGLRCRGQLAEDADIAPLFEQAVSLHEQTPDAFEAARTRLVYGERLRRARNRVLAREQLRAAAETFERLNARPGPIAPAPSSQRPARRAGNETQARSTN